MRSINIRHSQKNRTMRYGTTTDIVVRGWACCKISLISSIYQVAEARSNGFVISDEPIDMLRTSHRTRNHGFTLIELLVVTAIISILVSILLPALSQAREVTRRTVCLSNQRQLAIAVQFYARDYGDFLPPSPFWMNAQSTFYLYYQGTTAGVGVHKGWVAQGLLFGLGYLDSAEFLYCPSQKADVFTYPFGWDEMFDMYNLRVGGYVYRIFGQTASGISQEDVDELINMRLENLPGPMALSSDIFINRYRPGSIYYLYNGKTWPHIEPYYVNVAYSDGHAEGVNAGVNQYERSSSLTVLANKRDYYAYMFFRSLDTQDFSELEEEFPLP